MLSSLFGGWGTKKQESPEQSPIEDEEEDEYEDDELEDDEFEDAVDSEPIDEAADRNSIGLSKLDISTRPPIPTMTRVVGPTGRRLPTARPKPPTTDVADFYAKLSKKRMREGSFLEESGDENATVVAPAPTLLTSTTSTFPRNIGPVRRAPKAREMPVRLSSTHKMAGVAQDLLTAANTGTPARRSSRISSRTSATVQESLPKPENSASKQSSISTATTEVRQSAQGGKSPLKLAPKIVEAPAASSSQVTDVQNTSTILVVEQPEPRVRAFRRVTRSQSRNGNAAATATTTNKFKAATVMGPAHKFSPTQAAKDLPISRPAHMTSSSQINKAPVVQKNTPRDSSRQKEDVVEAQPHNINRFGTSTRPAHLISSSQQLGPDQPSASTTQRPPHMVSSSQINRQADQQAAQKSTQVPTSMTSRTDNPSFRQMLESIAQTSAALSVELPTTLTSRLDPPTSTASLSPQDEIRRDAVLLNYDTAHALERIAYLVSRTDLSKIPHQALRISSSTIL